MTDKTEASGVLTALVAHVLRRETVPAMVLAERPLDAVPMCSNVTGAPLSQVLLDALAPKAHQSIQSADRRALL